MLKTGQIKLFYIENASAPSRVNVVKMQKHLFSYENFEKTTQKSIQILNIFKDENVVGTFLKTIPVH
jgi:hypothetical protein